MSRTAAVRPAVAPEPVTAASIITILDGIERHGLGAPAAIAFRAALKRKGSEADAAGGLVAVDELLAAVVADDPARADARTAILRGAWGELLPGPGGRAKA